MFSCAGRGAFFGGMLLVVELIYLGIDANRQSKVRGNFSIGVVCVTLGPASSPGKSRWCDHVLY